jgi:23S rRNA (guanosine2251-2'-O)-methyltransferase
MDGKKGGKGRGFEKFFGGKGSRPQGGGRAHGDRPQGDRPRGDRPYGDRPYGDRPYGGKPRDDRPQGDRPYGGRPRGDRPQGDRPYGKRDDRPQGDRPYSGKSRDDRPQGDRPYGGNQRSDRPQGQYGHGGKPGDGRRYFDKDARPEGGKRPYDRGANSGDRPQRPFREDGRYDKGPGPRFSKAPERPVPPAVYEDGERRKPEAPRYNKPAQPGGAPRYGRPVQRDDANRPEPRYGKPVQRDDADRPAPRYGRPVENDRADRPEPRYGRPVDRDNADKPAPRYGRPTQKDGADRPAPRYGRPAPKFERPAPRFEKRDEEFDEPLQAEAEEAGIDNLLVGRNPIREALKAGQHIEKMLVAQGELSGSAKEIVAKAKDAGIVVQFVDRARLDAVYPNHQGMLAFASAASYASVDDILALAARKDESPFIVVLDGVTDPHNLGAIIRTAECCGAHGVIVPERRSAGLNPAAVKASAGALSYLPVARVGNLSRTLAELKEKGLWVIGCDMSGGDIRTSDLSGPVALVIGSEGEGISHLVLEGCDKVVSIPLKGQIASLNASVAAGIALYEVMRTRSGQ